MLKIFTAGAMVLLLGLPAAAQGGRAGNVTATGQTRPPSRDASPTARDNPNRRTKNDEQQDKLSRGICIGCNAR